MAYIHLLQHIRQGFSCLGLLLCGLLGCTWSMSCNGNGENTSNTAAEFQADLPGFSWQRQGKGWQCQVQMTNLGYRDLGTRQRVLLLAPALTVLDSAGQPCLQLSAQSGISIYPFTEITLRNFSLENRDTTTFEGGELVWPYQNEPGQMALLGKTLVVLSKTVVEADTVIGDLFLQGYEILHVHSVLPLGSDRDTLGIPTIID